MRHVSRLLLLASLASLTLLAQASANPFAGRWDLTIVTPDATYPSWMEVVDNNGAPEVHIVGRVSSVHTAKETKLSGATLSFVTSEWFGKPIGVSWEISAKSGKLSGTQKRGDGVTGKLTGVHAPTLARKMPANWSAPIPLFDGASLAGWEPLVTEQGKSPVNNWKAIGGELVNQAAGANIRTTRTFQDFKLHVEYNCPDDGNSGVYLRGRYELQVEYEPADRNDKFHGMGSIYGFLAPSEAVPPRPGQWESYDVVLVGRRVSVTRDDVKIVDNQQIPGITGGALDSREAAPGPLYIQGDHTGGMKYRNITISVPE